MEIRLKRFLSLALAIMMVFSLMPQIAFGAEAAGANSVNLAGSFNGWDTSATPMTMDGVTGTCTLELVAGTYKFKIVENSETWMGNNGTIVDTTITTSDVGWEFTSNGGDCTLQASGGKYHFSYNSDSNYLVITYEAADVEKTPYAPEVGLYAVGSTVSGSGFMNGVAWTPAEESNKMSETSDDVYEITFTNVSAGNYELKVAADKAWTHSWGTGAAVTSGQTVETYYNGGNSTLAVAEDGSTVTIKIDMTSTYAVNQAAKLTVTVTAPVVEECEHNAVDTDVTKDPTCTETGLQNIVCADCGHMVEENVEIGPLGHTFVDESGNALAECSVCSEPNPDYKASVPEADSELTIPEANALGEAQDTSAYTTDKYYVTGVITSVSNATWGNMYIKDDEGNTLYVYGTYDADGTNSYANMETQPVAGDTVKVYGIIGNYKGAPQMKNGWIVDHTPGEGAPEVELPEDGSTLTIAEVLALSTVLTGDTTEKYFVTGEIDSVYETTYGNMYIKDEAGNTLTVYGTYSADGSTRYDAMETQPVAGDTVTVYGILSVYGGKAQVKNGWIVEHIAAACEHESHGQDGLCENCGVAVGHTFVNGECECGIDDTLTVAEANALGLTYSSGSYTAEKYYVTGVITEVYETNWGNMYIKDDEGNTLTVYGTYDADGTNRYDVMETQPVAGDTITVYGIIGQYGGTAQMKNGWIVAHTPAESAPEAPYRSYDEETDTESTNVDNKFACMFVCESGIEEHKAAGTTYSSVYCHPGEVVKGEDGNYTCLVTVDVENVWDTWAAMSGMGVVPANHEKPAFEDTYSVVYTWDVEQELWTINEGIVISVACTDEEPEAPEIVIPETAPEGVDEDLWSGIVSDAGSNEAAKNFELPEGVESLTITLSSVQQDTETGAVKVSYDVTPGWTEGAVSITFRLPVTGSDTQTHVNVYHENDLMGKYEVQNEDGGLYVEITSSEFSIYTVEEIVEVVNYPVYIGEQGYESLADAVADAESGATITLKAGTYDLPLFSGKELTFVGEDKETVFVNDAPDARAQGWNGSTFHFENLTANGATENYHGLANGVVAVTYKNCNINGLRFLYAHDVSFENCAFNAEGVEHSFWTYGASNVTVTGCTFTYTDRAVNCYSENGAAHELEIAFDGCTFTYAGTDENHEGAVEINSSSVKSIDVTMDDCTGTDGETVWFNSQWDGKQGENTVVTVDGEIVWQAPKGTITPCFTYANTFWGEGTSNSLVSFVVELYEGENKIASSTLSSDMIGNLSDGSTYVTWSIPFDGADTEEWDVEWAEGYPKADMAPTAVKLIVDGKEVATNNVQLNAPDNLFPIVAVITDENGAFTGYAAAKDLSNVAAGSTITLIKNLTVASGETIKLNNVNLVAAEGVTVTNNGTILVSGKTDIAATVTGSGWVYMNGVTMSAATKLHGAKVGFINGTNTIVGSTIDNGWFSVGIGKDSDAATAAAFAEANGITLGDVTVNVSGNAVIGSGGSAYNGWIGSAYSADKTTNKYVLNVENSLATFGYMHVSKDGTLNVKGHSANKYTYDNANVDFYAGELIVNGTVTLDGTDAWVKYTKMSVDHADGVLNIQNGTKYEASIHNGATTGTALKFWKSGKINVSDSVVEIDNGVTMVEGAELNITNSEVTGKGVVTNNGVVNVNGGTMNGVTIAGSGKTVFSDTVNFYGTNSITSAIDGAPFHLVVNKGATLLISRFVLGYDRAITVYGEIEDAHSFDPTDKTPSLKFNSTSGVSVGGTGTGNLTVQDAYVELGNSSWKNAQGTYEWKFTNSYVSATSFTNNNSGYTDTAAWNVTFDDSVLTAKNYIKNGVGTTYNFTNGSVATTGSVRIDGVMNIDETSSVTTTAQQNNVVGAVDEHGGINGTVNVDGTLTIGATSTTQLEMLGGELNIGAEAKVDLGNNSLTLDENSKLVLDVSGMTAGEYAGIEGTVVNGGTIELVGETELLATIDADGNIVLVEPVAKVGETTFATLQAAVDAVKDGETIVVLRDVTVEEAGATNNNAVYYTGDKSFTIDLNGKTVTGNTSNVVFRFQKAEGEENTITITNGKIVAGENCWSAVSVGSDAVTKTYINLTELTIEANKRNDFAVRARAGAIFTVTDCVINANNYGGGVAASGGEATLNNVTITQSGLDASAPWNSAAFGISGGGKMTINSGSYYAAPKAAADGNNQGTSHGSWVGIVMNSGGTLIINGGTFQNDNFGDNADATAARGLIEADTGAVVEINGGTFNALKSILAITNNLGDASKNPSATLAGGTFSADPRISGLYASELIKVAEGYKVVENENGTYTVKAAREAMIVGAYGVKYFETLADAVAAAKDGDTVILQANIVLSDVLTIDKNLTIADYGALKLSCAEGGAIHITENHNLTLDKVILTAPVYADSNTAGATIGNALAITGTSEYKSIVTSDGTEVVVKNPDWVADVNGEVYYLTIDDAIKGAVAGDTVNIYAGEYTGNLSVDKDITVIGETDDEGNNLVSINGKLSITADGATVKNINVNNGGSTAGYISAKDVLVEGCSVVGSNGFRYCYTSGTVTFKDSTITGSTYGIHFDGSAGGNIVIDNCVITGWTSFAGTIEKVTMKDTTFAEGNYNYIRFYQDADISGCTFNEKMGVDVSDSVSATVTVTNSTVENGSVEDLFEKADIINSDIYVDDVLLTLTGSIRLRNATLNLLDKVCIIYKATDDLVETNDEDVVERGVLLYKSAELAATKDPSKAYETVKLEWNAAEQKYVGQTEGIDARDMGDSQFAVAYMKMADGTYIFGTKEGAEHIVEYSPLIYCNAYKEDTSTVGMLCRALMHYGAAAQVEQYGKTDGLMNEGFAAVPYDESVLGETVFSANTEVTNGMKLRSVTMDLKGAISYIVKFTVEDESIADKQLYAEYTLLGKTGSVELTEGSDDRLWATISGIPAKDMGATLRVKSYYLGENGEKVYGGELVYSGYEYIRSAQTNASYTAEVKALTRAMAMYIHYADVYGN